MGRKAFMTLMAFAPVASHAEGGVSKADTTAPRPNIVLILADDMGYSDIGCYGGEIETPNLDRLASQGIRYRQFYNGARSCPTRASLLTGLYAHQAGIGWMTAADMGRAPYQGYLNRECVTLAEVLQSAGYGTYMSGKWHVATERQNKAKMKEYWPNQRGFEQYFGIVEGASNYFHTTLNRNNDQHVQPEDPDFYLTYALSDSAAMFIRQHDYAQKPLFLYMAYNAPHWPLQALPQDIARYKDRYMRGWDVLRQERFERQKQMGLFPKSAVLSDRDSQVPAWNSLTPEEQDEFASRMAIYAAQVDEMDCGIGRIVTALEERGQLDNTIIMFLSDNGACAEFISSGKRKALDGKSDTYESYRRNWANLSSTPYKEYKHHTNEGGIASPMVVHYPNGIDGKLNGSWCDEYGHITDIMTTFVALSGAQYPTQYKGHKIQQMEGVSLLPNFEGKKTGRGETFWEHEGNIGVRDGRWKIVTKVVEDEPYDESKIMLYDIKKDPTELHDLAAKKPKLKNRLYADWTRWAERVGVLPIDTRGYGRRQQDFRREKMNGSFDEWLGDWAQSSSGPAKVTFEIDTVNVISAPHTCHICVEKTGARPANGFLKWGFRGHKDETITASFKIRSSEATNIKFRLEDQDHVEIKPIDQSVDLSGGDVQQFTFTSTPLQRTGGFQLVFYVGSAHGDIWIDDVKMDYHL